MSIDEEFLINDEEQKKIDKALRPESFDTYIGQKNLIDKLKIAVKASKERSEPVPHILATGNAGLGKTSLAKVVSKEYGSYFKEINSTSINSIGDLTETLTKVPEFGIVLLDECHRLNKNIQDSLLTCLEDGKICIKLLNKQIVQVKLNPFTFIGATTNLGKLSKPFIDRFDLQHQMEFYSNEEIAQIITANIDKIGVVVDSQETILNMASRARGTPRIANRILRRVRDFAQVLKAKTVTNKIVEDSMALEGIGVNGLTKSDDKYLQILWSTYKGGPAGKEAISSSINEDAMTIEDYIEPFLLREEYIARTGRGRILTEKGIKYVLGE